MSIIDTSSLVKKEATAVEFDGGSPDFKGSPKSILKLPKVPSAIVASLRSKFDKLKVGIAVVTAAALPFASGCSKSESESYGAQGPNSPSAVSQSILPMTPGTKISLERSVKIAQALASLSTDLKVVHKDIGALQKIAGSPTNTVELEKAVLKEKVAAQGRLERSSKIALLGTEQALKYVPTNQTFNALQMALKMAAQASKGNSASDAKVLSESAKVIENVGKGLSDIIERLGPAEHVVQLMDLRLSSQAAHKEISSMLSTLGSLTTGVVSSLNYPKVQKAGHEAEFAAKVFKDASTNTFFTSLSTELQEVSSGLTYIATNSVSYVAYAKALGSAEKVASFKSESSKTLGKLSVLYDKVGEELSSLGSLGVVEMMTAPSGGITATNTSSATASTVATTTYHSHPVFFHSYWRPWYGGYYYDGPSHYSSGLWQGFSSSRPVTSYSSSVHSSAPSPSAGVSSINGGVGSASSASKAGVGGFGIAQHGFGSTTSVKSGFTSSAGSAAHGEGGTHSSGSSSSSGHGSSSGSSAGKGSSVGHSGGFGGGAAGHGSSSGG